MNTERILLIDDEPSLQLTVGDQLRMEGYEVMGATTGDEALQILRQRPPDLIILDISMPGMSGLTLLKKLSDPDGKPRYPILVFTARANMEPFFSTMGVEGFLSKTSDPSLLISEVKRILQKTKKTLSPSTHAEPGKKKSIIILEDNPLLSKRMETSFIAAGYNAVAILDSRFLAETITSRAPSIILIKAILSGTTGSTIAAALIDFPDAKGIPIILFDGTGVYQQGNKFINVDRFVPSSNPADLLKTIAGMIG
ncbi:MAG: response regulator [bacterium]|jgi:DNA-binding response OmpR family regulator